MSFKSKCTMAIATGVAGAAIAAGQAGAAVAAPSETCQANPVRVNVLGLALAPYSANPGSGPCVTAATDLVKPTTVGQGGFSVVAAALNGRTFSDPIPSADANVAGAAIIVPGYTILAQTLASHAAAFCFTGSGASTVAVLRVNNRAIELPNPNRPVHIGLGTLGSIDVNQTVVGPAGVTQRAVFVHTIFGDVALAETSATSTACPLT
jgi:hypothetical protein